MGLGPRVRDGGWSDPRAEGTGAVAGRWSEGGCGAGRMMRVNCDVSLAGTVAM